MEMMLYIVADALLGGITLWLASNITSVDLQIKETIIAAGAAALASIAPAIGWLLSIIILFYLLKKFSHANIWPDIILMVLVSRFVVFIIAAALVGLN